MDALHFRDVYFCDVSAPIWGASLGAALVAAPPQAGNQLTAVSTPLSSLLDSGLPAFGATAGWLLSAPTVIVKPKMLSGESLFFAQILMPLPDMIYYSLCLFLAPLGEYLC